MSTQDVEDMKKFLETFSPRRTAECPKCGAYMMDATKHRQWHDWLERQLEMGQAMGGAR